MKRQNYRQDNTSNARAQPKSFSFPPHLSRKAALVLIAPASVASSIQSLPQLEWLGHRILVSCTSSWTVPAQISSTSSLESRPLLKDRMSTSLSFCNLMCLLIFGTRHLALPSICHLGIKFSQQTGSALQFLAVPAPICINFALGQYQCMSDNIQKENSRR